MEVYLNSIEMGDGIYGAEAVAKSSLSHHGLSTHSQTMCTYCSQSAESKKIQFRKPSPYMYKRQRKIMYLMKCVPTFPGKKPKSKETSRG